MENSKLFFFYSQTEETGGDYSLFLVIENPYKIVGARLKPSFQSTV